MKLTYLPASLVLVMMFAQVAAAQTAPAQLVDNPIYQSWSSQKVGTKVTSRAETLAQGMTIAMEVVQTLVEVKPEKLTLEVVTTIDMMGSRQSQPAQKQEVAAKVDASQANLPSGVGANAAISNVTMKQVGKESVEVGGKKYDCVIHEFEATTAQGKMTGKLWNTPLIPGNLAKSETNIAGRLTATSKTTVTLIEAK